MSDNEPPDEQPTPEPASPPSGPLLTAEQIEQIDDCPTRRVHVPAWGGDVIVRSIRGDERDAFDHWCERAEKAGRLSAQCVRARLAAMVCVDEEGRQLFKPKDILWLGQKSARALDAIWDAAAELNGLSDKQIEVLEKN